MVEFQSLGFMVLVQLPVAVVFKIELVLHLQDVIQPDYDYLFVPFTQRVANVSSPTPSFFFSARATASTIAAPAVRTAPPGLILR
jgi:hypothetical protein